MGLQVPTVNVWFKVMGWRGTLGGWLSKRMWSCGAKTRGNLTGGVSLSRMNDAEGVREDLFEGSYCSEKEILRKAPSEPGRGLSRGKNS